MIRATLLSTLVAAVALTSGSAFAESPNIGTAGRAQESAGQFSADNNGPVRSDRMSLSTGTQTYGAPINTREVLIENERPNVAPEQTQGGAYLGTADIYQDNADANTAF